MTSSRTAPRQVAAAGVVPWRRPSGRLEVALVHRPRYDDWAWSKGKLDAGEHWPGAAVREADEEMGLRVALGLPLPAAEYDVRDRSGKPQPKQVRYWAAHVVGGKGRLNYEVDKVRWVRPKIAQKMLTYSRDRDQLEAVVEADDGGLLRTWPLLLVRHAKAVPRRHWSKNDWIRPLDARGTHQSKDLVAVLRAYDVRRVETSSATRCVQTVAPYAKAAGLRLRSTRVLSEEGYEDNRRLAWSSLDRLFEAGVPSALCSHGPLFPDLLERIEDRVPGRHCVVTDQLAEVLQHNLVKGEALVCHVRGRGAKAKVVALERHLPVR